MFEVSREGLKEGGKAKLLHFPAGSPCTRPKVSAERLQLGALCPGGGEGEQPLPILPSMETFLRRFWRLGLEEQGRLAGGCMAAVRGSVLLGEGAV